ncbi:hypothetical protein [Streptomyces sp. NPDC056987]|uniref:hypothetical protein n=1 Tax=Streptomyces sp. NPDC056987 TaxID=3345988 RepID=UPI003632FFDD
MGTHEVMVALAADGRAWVDGVEVNAGHGTLEESRAAALEQVRRIVRQRRRAVRVAATDPDGSLWRFGVVLDGTVVTPEQVQEAMTDPDAVEVPAAYQHRAAAVSAALDGGQEHIAMRLALLLEEDAAQEHGPEHPYVLRARELRAHATAECGLPSAGAELYLDAARGWARLHSDAYWGAVQRAYALWHRAAENEARMVWIGEQLVDVLREAGDRSHMPIRTVLRRVDELRFKSAG